MPDYKLEVVIKKVSDSDMEYIIQQLKDAVEICNGKLEFPELAIVIIDPDYNKRFQESQRKENG